MRHFIITLINNLILFITFIFPPTNKIVLVGGWFGKRFADNSKAFFLFLNEHKAELGIKKVIYITVNKNIIHDLTKQGYKCYKKLSLRSIYYHLRAKVHIVDQGANDINKYLGARAIKINLWHGFPLKKIGRMTISREEEVKNQKYARCQVGNWQDAFYLSTSKEMSRLWCLAFYTDKEHIIESIYPRDAYLMGEIKKIYLESEKPYLKKIIELHTSSCKILLYLPTFRDNAEVNERCMHDILKLQPFLNDHNMFLITKMHFAAYLKTDHNQYPHIINLPSEADVYNFLEYADILVTDYSSVYFDFMLLRRPIVFYCFDLQYYMNSDRGFVYDYNSFAPGEKAFTIDELKEKIIYSLSLSADDIDRLQRDVRNVVFDNKTISADTLCKTWFPQLKVPD